MPHDLQSLGFALFCKKRPVEGRNGIHQQRRHHAIHVSQEINPNAQPPGGRRPPWRRPEAAVEVRAAGCPEWHRAEKRGVWPPEAHAVADRRQGIAPYPYICIGPVLQSREAGLFSFQWVFSRLRATVFTLESHPGILSLGSIVNTICGFRIKLPKTWIGKRFSFSQPRHENFPAPPDLCQRRSWNKWYLSIEQSVRTMCGNTQIRFMPWKPIWRRSGSTMVIHAVAKKWKILNTLYVVVALKRGNTYSVWLSSMKTVALKRENTH